MTKTFIRLNEQGAYEYGTFVQLSRRKEVLTTIGTELNYEDAHKAMLAIRRAASAVDQVG